MEIPINRLEFLHNLLEMRGKSVADNVSDGRIEPSGADRAMLSTS
jgi:hypothetical protein